MLKLGHIEMLLELLEDHPAQEAKEIVEIFKHNKECIEESDNKFLCFMKYAGHYKTHDVIFNYDYEMNQVDCIAIKDRCIHILSDNAKCIYEYFEDYEIKIRFCNYCGAPMQEGFTDECGDTYFCCYAEFAKDMNERYGDGNWRAEPTGKQEWNYETLKNGEWISEPSFYTEWY